MCIPGELSFRLVNPNPALIWTQNARHKPETADSEARRAREREREREPREERARANEEREKEEKEENMENQKLFCWQCGDRITK